MVKAWSCTQSYRAGTLITQLPSLLGPPYRSVSPLPALQMHFQDCGTVNRVTILTDKMGNPKGFAYIEFLEVDAVAQACLLEGTELRGRQLKVCIAWLGL